MKNVLERLIMAELKTTSKLTASTSFPSLIVTGKPGLPLSNDRFTFCPAVLVAPRAKSGMETTRAVELVIPKVATKFPPGVPLASPSNNSPVVLLNPFALLKMINGGVWSLVIMQLIFPSEQI